MTMHIVCRLCATEYAMGPRKPKQPDPCPSCVDIEAPQGVEAASAPLTLWSAPPRRRPGRPPAPTRVAKGKAQPHSRAPRRRAAGVLLHPALAAAVLAAALGSAVAARAGIVAALPESAALYAAIGLPVNLRGLALLDVRSDIVREGERSILSVEGRIENVTARAVAVPRLEVALRGTRGQVVYSWSLAPAKDTLAARESVAFRGRLATPPPDAAEAEVTFAPPARRTAVASRSP
jgi:hypothetical protein